MKAPGARRCLFLNSFYNGGIKKKAWGYPERAAGKVILGLFGDTLFLDTLRMKIFRYFPPARVDVLEQQRISFSPPLRFNDPFDLHPIFAPITDKKYLEGQLPEFKQFLEHIFPHNPEITKAMAENAVQVWQEDAYLLAEAREKLACERLNQEFGIVCFSELKDNLLMWAHYAESHKGFVVEFETDDESFKRLGKFEQVSYSAQRPIYDDAKETSMDIYLVKSLEWSYEKEYRVFRPLKSCAREVMNGIELFFTSLPHTCISAVYIGNRMEQTLRERLLNTIAKTPIKPYRSLLNKTCFGLEFEPIRKA